MCVSIKLSPSCSITKDDIKKLTFLTINDDKKNEKSFQNITPSVFEILQSKFPTEFKISQFLGWIKISGAKIAHRVSNKNNCQDSLWEVKYEKKPWLINKIGAFCIQSW